jgi:hypothetical protein
MTPPFSAVGIPSDRKYDSNECENLNHILAEFKNVKAKTKQRESKSNQERK